jgi:probable rRNA maturation factor
MTTQPKHRIYVTRKQRSRDNEKATLMIRRCVKATLDAEGVRLPCEVNVTITSNSDIRSVNYNTRGVDKATDVLSFPMFELKPGEFKAGENDVDPETGRLFLGDIMISLDKVADQAERFGHSKEREMAYLVVHSALHLLGYDHTDEGREKMRMRRREKDILRKLGINDNE